MVIAPRVLLQQTATDANLLQRASGPAVIETGDAMNRMQALRIGLRQRVAEPARPVQVRAGDNLPLHRATALARPGDAIVRHGGGEVTAALAGDLMAGRALSRVVGDRQGRLGPQPGREHLGRTELLGARLISGEAAA